MSYDRLEAEWSFTDQEREAYDYEFNAQFDRWDGWGDIDPAWEAAYDDGIGCAADYRFDDNPAPVSDAALNDYVDPNDDVPF